MTIAAGSDTATITITVLDDAVFETPEAFTVVLSAAELVDSSEALAITADTGTGNIVDDQASVSIAEFGQPNPQTEGPDSTITFTVTLSAVADEVTLVT